MHHLTTQKSISYYDTKDTINIHLPPIFMASNLPLVLEYTPNPCIIQHSKLPPLITMPKTLSTFIFHFPPTFMAFNLPLVYSIHQSIIQQCKLPPLITIQKTPSTFIIHLPPTLMAFNLPLALEYSSTHHLT